MFSEHATQENDFDEDVLDMVHGKSETCPAKQILFKKIIDNDHKMNQFCRLLCQEMKMPKDKWRQLAQVLTNVSLRMYWRWRGGELSY